jgi:hypothetical protein
LEALRFHDKLSFLLSELIDEGVGGSSGLESGGGDFGGLAAAGFCARGPEGLVWWIAKSGAVSSGAVKSPPVFDLFKKAASMWPPLGSEELKKGEGPDLCPPFLTAVKESDELAGSGGGGVSRLKRCMELLLLRC